jgi:D-sedoheptulose 7-phosphate isomerase
MKDVCDILISVPAVETYRVQEFHLPLYHALCAMVEAEFFGDNR